MIPLATMDRAYSRYEVFSFLDSWPCLCHQPQVAERIGTGIKNVMFRGRGAIRNITHRNRQGRTISNPHFASPFQYDYRFFVAAGAVLTDRSAGSQDYKT